MDHLSYTTWSLINSVVVDQSLPINDWLLVSLMVDEGIVYGSMIMVSLMVQEMIYLYDSQLIVKKLPVSFWYFY